MGVFTGQTTSWMYGTPNGKKVGVEKFRISSGTFSSFTADGYTYYVVTSPTTIVFDGPGIIDNLLIVAGGGGSDASRTGGGASGPYGTSGTVTAAPGGGGSNQRSALPGTGGGGGGNPAAGAPGIVIFRLIPED